MLKDKSFLKGSNLVRELNNQTSEVISGGRCEEERRFEFIGWGEKACQKMKEMCDPGTYKLSSVNPACMCEDSKNWRNRWWEKDENVLVSGYEIKKTCS